MILTIDQLKWDLTQHGTPPRMALACGCFDVLTVGHVRHLRAARLKGNLLCVLVTADRFISKPGRPIFAEEFRAEVVDSLRCVDYVVVGQHPTAAEAIRLLRPAVYVKGGEYRDRPTLQLCAERDAANEVGCRIEFTDGVEVHSSEVMRKMGL